MVASEQADIIQQEKSDSCPNCIRRQVSDLGMEDPVMLETRRRKKPTITVPVEPESTKVKDDGDSTASTCGGGVNTARTPQKKVNVVENDEDDTEMDFDDLMSMSSRRTSVSRCSSATSKAGSMALRAMSDSFTNGSFDSSSNNSNQELSLSDLNGSLSNSNHHDGTSDDAPVAAAPTNRTTPSGRTGRKLPQRTGSGYVRTGGAQRSDSSSSSSHAARRALRSSVIKSNNGVVVSSSALREKRRSSNLSNASFSQLSTSISQLRR